MKEIECLKKCAKLEEVKSDIRKELFYKDSSFLFLLKGLIVVFLETKEDIQKCDFINNLSNLTSKFGINGAYINFNNAKNPKNNGIYFVCGFSAMEIREKNLDLEQLLLDQAKNQNRFRLDIHVEKLTCCAPFAVHQSVMRYCINASFMKVLFNKYKFNKKLHYIPYSFFNYCKNNYEKNLCSDNVVEKEKLDDALNHFIHSAGDELYRCGEVSLTHDEKLVLKEKKLDDARPNMVGLTELLHKTNTTKKIVVSDEAVNKFRKYLNQRPDILYFEPLPYYTTYKLNGQEYSQGTTTYIYDGAFEKDVKIMALKSEKPSLFTDSMREVLNVNGDVSTFGVSVSDLDNIFKSCHDARIPICINQSKPFFNTEDTHRSIPDANGDVYTVCIPSSSTQTVGYMLKNEAKRFQEYRIQDRYDEAYNFVPNAYVPVEHGNNSVTR